MKKVKFTGLFLLIFTVIVSSGAGNLLIPKNNITLQAHGLNAPVRLIDQILFPHGM